MIILVHEMELKQMQHLRTTVPNLMTSIGETVSMCVAPVKIRTVNKKWEVTSYTLLDNYSQGTYAREDIVLTLEASGERTKVRVKTMSGEQRHLSTAVDDVEFANNNNTNNSGSNFQKTTQLQICHLIYLFIYLFFVYFF